SDLRRSEVYDADGRHLGSVYDVRMVQDGPLLLPFGHAFRVTGLAVGRPSVATRLGYHRGGISGPWLLRVIFTRIERRSRYVPWTDVVSWDGARVQISKRRDDLRAFSPEDD